MNSALNPEAPEFYPHLMSYTEAGYTKVTKTVKASRKFPTGDSLQLFKTFTDFNVVTYSISENIIEQTTQILCTELSTPKLKGHDNEHNTEKITDANDSMMDRVNINIDTICGVNEPSQQFMESVKTPIISKIQVGSTTFIGAKNIPRPQLMFKDSVDNSNNLWVPKISEKPNNIKPLSLNMLYDSQGKAVGYEHPYTTELELYKPPQQFIDPDPTPPVMPPPVESIKYTFVDTEEKLNALINHLFTVAELAVDVEHHSYRTYQGITCLIQLTTDKGGDFIIDTLVIREHIHKLNVIFTDPKKLKVFHGAQNDVLWLQRDFGLYIVGLFDTYQAAKMLSLSALSLKHLLLKYCQFNADKTHQLADWRIRPLPEALISYARTDTHYLLYIWRKMKEELLEKSAQQPHLLLAVFESSRQICGNTYKKEVIDDNSHNQLIYNSGKMFTTRQKMALKALYQYRDAKARELDESVTYLIPNHMLIKIAETLPRDVQGITACCSPVPPFVHQNLVTIHQIILSSRDIPDEPQLYAMPASLQAVLNLDTPFRACFQVHDYSCFSEHEENNSNFDCNIMLEFDSSYVCPDIQVFQPDNNEEAYPKVVSKLNAEAKLFIPPYDRYRKYRYLAQMEEIKEKDAKLSAIEKNKLIKNNDKLINEIDAKNKNEDKLIKDEGNKLIKDEGNKLIKDEGIKLIKDEGNNLIKEVTESVQETQTQIAQINDQNTSQSNVTPNVKGIDTNEVDNKIAQRKRKISTEKRTGKESANLVAEQDTNNASKTSRAVANMVSPYKYISANYKKFYDDLRNKETKSQLKKYKRK